MNVISKNEYDYIANTCMTADEAYEYLNKNMQPRRFSETLSVFGDGMDIKSVLSDALCRYSPDVSRDGIVKKVRAWLEGKYEPSDRETYLQICFALKLTENMAQNFLCCCTDCGFHSRSPRELAYSFALRIGMDYPGAVSLYKSLPQPSVSDASAYTEPLFNEFYHIQTVEDFRSFYTSNLDKLGALHNTAYKYFKSFIDCLRDPDAGRRELFGNGSEISDIFSIERVTSEYLRMNVPSEHRESQYNYIQRMMKKYWPSATSIKNMLNRKEDVTRKTLILLYLITEGIAPGVNYDFVIDDGMTPAERFGEHYDRICIMLTDCGMALPDPRNVFDWAALYAVKMNNAEEIGKELQGLIDRIFSVTERELTQTAERMLK